MTETEDLSPELIVLRKIVLSQENIQRFLSAIEAEEREQRELQQQLQQIRRKEAWVGGTTQEERNEV